MVGRQNGGVSGKRSQTAEDSRSPAKQPFLTPNPTRTLPVTTRVPSPGLPYPTGCNPNTSRHPLERIVVRGQNGFETFERATSPAQATVEDPRIKVPQRHRSSLSPVPSKQSSRDCQQHLADVTTAQLPSATTRATAASLLPQPASDTSLPWPHSPNSPTKAESLQQVSALIPREVNSVVVPTQGLTYRSGKAGRLSSSGLGSSEETLENGSRHVRTRSQKMVMLWPETYRHRPASEAEETRSDKAARRSRSERPLSQLLLPTETSRRPCHPSTLQRPGQAPPNSGYLVDCITRVKKTCAACTPVQVKCLSTVERVTGACAVHQTLPHQRLMHHCPMDGGSLYSRIKSKQKNAFRDPVICQHEPKLSTRPNTSAFIFDGMVRPAAQRRTSAPQLLSSRHVVQVVDPRKAYAADEPNGRTTSTYTHKEFSQEGLTWVKQATGQCPSMMGLIPPGEMRLQSYHLSYQQTFDNDITKGTTERYYGKCSQAGGVVPLTAFIDRSNAGCLIPSGEDTENGSEGGEDMGPDTPLTSPCTSPAKSTPGKDRLVHSKDALVQLDGPHDTFDRNSLGQDRSPQADDGHDDGNNQREELTPPQLDDTTFLDPGPAYQRRYFSSIERFPNESSEHDVYETALEADDTGDVADEATPLVSPSPAKGTTAFPFPGKLNISMPERLLSRARCPSALLWQCEGLATSRQRQLMRGGARTPDRFVPLRTATPTKESLFLSTPAPKLSASRKRSGRRSPPADPFGATPRRSLRMAEQFATIRSPDPANRPFGLRTSLVPNADSSPHRSASAGAVWSVGGTTTTEGVASTTNSRGGRVTSGTSAPHYAADFLRRNTPSEEEVTHGRRLAFAMDIDQSARMLNHSLPSSPNVGSPASSSSKDGWAWRDGAWENASSPLTRVLP